MRPLIKVHPETGRRSLLIGRHAYAIPGMPAQESERLLAYLVELAFKSPELRFAHVIGITQFGSRVYAKFDAVKVGGFRYPIDSIYKMTRGEARDLVRGARA